MPDELIPNGSGDGSELLLYQTEDGRTRVQVRMLDETVGSVSGNWRSCSQSQKITDIYATAVDYSKESPTIHEFFATVQNKMHYAIHGRTAAEMVVERVDAAKPNMGLTTWKDSPHGSIKRPDTYIGKNYLSEDELTSLELIVDQYLSFAEFQARERKEMTMAQWRKKLDDFLTLNDREI